MFERRLLGEGFGELVEAREGVVVREGGLRSEEGEVECKWRARDWEKMSFVTRDWSVNDALVLNEKLRWSCTNVTKLLLMLRYDNVLEALPRGKARVFARL